MTFDTALKVVSMLDWPHVNSVAPAVPGGFSPEAVGAIASSVSALIAASALAVAVRTYLDNSRAAARSQAGQVSAKRTVTGNPGPIEIRITNYSQENIFDLSLILRTSSWKTALPPPQLDWVNGLIVGNLLRPTYSRWLLGNGALIPPGVSTLKVYLPPGEKVHLTPGERKPISSNVAIGFVDVNGRAWTRRLDGKLIKGWKIP